MGGAGLVGLRVCVWRVEGVRCSHGGQQVVVAGMVAVLHLLSVSPSKQACRGVGEQEVHSAPCLQPCQHSRPASLAA